jgi:putative phosphoribosyl transferase
MRYESSCTRALRRWKDRGDCLNNAGTHETVAIDVDAGPIEGDLRIPDGVAGIVIFAHGSGSSRVSERNRAVAAALERANLATLLLDLLTPEEEAVDIRTRMYRFDISLLANRVVGAIDWTQQRVDLRPLPVALFGASTGAAAALIAAAERAGVTKAVISRGGRPDLADGTLPLVEAPTLLIVGGADEGVIALNRGAMRFMHAPVELAVVPGATHLFEEPGALEMVASLAVEWCERHLVAAQRRRPEKGRRGENLTGEQRRGEPDRRTEKGRT